VVVVRDETEVGGSHGGREQQKRIEATESRWSSSERE